MAFSVDEHLSVRSLHNLQLYRSCKSYSELFTLVAFSSSGAKIQTEIVVVKPNFILVIHKQESIAKTWKDALLTPPVSCNTIHVAEPKQVWVKKSTSPKFQGPNIVETSPQPRGMKNVALNTNGFNKKEKWVMSQELPYPFSVVNRPWALKDQHGNEKMSPPWGGAQFSSAFEPGVQSPKSKYAYRGKGTPTLGHKETIVVRPNSYGLTTKEGSQTNMRRVKRYPQQNGLQKNPRHDLAPKPVGHKRSQVYLSRGEMNSQHREFHIPPRKAMNPQPLGRRGPKPSRPIKGVKVGKHHEPNIKLAMDKTKQEVVKNPPMLQINQPCHIGQIKVLYKASPAKKPLYSEKNKRGDTKRDLSPIPILTAKSNKGTPYRKYDIRQGRETNKLPILKDGRVLPKARRGYKPLTREVVMTISTRSKATTSSNPAAQTNATVLAAATNKSLESGEIRQSPVFQLEENKGHNPRSRTKNNEPKKNVEGDTSEKEEVASSSSSSSRSIESTPEQARRNNDEVAMLKAQIAQQDRQMTLLMAQVEGLVTQLSRTTTNPQILEPNSTRPRSTHKKLKGSKPVTPPQTWIGANAQVGYNTQSYGNPYSDPYKANPLPIPIMGGSLDPSLLAYVNDLIKREIKRNEDGMTHNLKIVTKPYPSWVDKVPFPPGFTQPEFRRFDGKGNPREHVAHFIARLAQLGENKLLWLQLFVQSLEGPAFVWYSNLPEGSIPDWDSLIREFYNQFSNTERRVGVAELIETKQRDNESVSDFIARWQALTFRCQQKFTQAEMVRMCLNNLKHELSVHLMPQTFDGFNDLCTKAHDLETHMGKRRVRPRANEKVETAVVETKKKSPINIGKPKREDTKVNMSGGSRPSFKERMEKKFSFPDEILKDLFEELKDQGLIDLPEAKRPGEVGKTDNPRYCPYHRLVGHSIEECFILKERIESLIKNGDIELPHIEKTSANPISLILDLDGSIDSTEDYLQDESQSSNDEWILFESKGAKKRREWGSKLATRKSPRLTPKKSRRPKITKDKKKKKKKSKRVEKLDSNDVLVQPSRFPITLNDYIPSEYRTNSEEGDHEKETSSHNDKDVIASCLTINVISDDESNEWDNTEDQVSNVNTCKDESCDVNDNHCLSCNVITIDVDFGRRNVDVSMTAFDQAKSVINVQEANPSKAKICIDLANGLDDPNRVIIPRNGIIKSPYSEWVEQVAYPSGYVIPNFFPYRGAGCPRKHLVLFLASCGNSAESQALLLRQFPLSLEHIALEWYLHLLPNSISDWDTLADKFYRTFYIPSPLQEIFNDWEEPDNVSVENYYLMGDSIEDEVETALELKEMATFMPRVLRYVFANFLSLDGIAFDWYCSLRNLFIFSWEEMKELFIEEQPKYRRDPQFLRQKAIAQRLKHQSLQNNEELIDEDEPSVSSCNMVQIKDNDSLDIIEESNFLRGRRRLIDVPITGEDETPLIKSSESKEEKVKYDILAHLKRIPSSLSIYDALTMSDELRKSLIYALAKPEDFRNDLHPKLVENATSPGLTQVPIMVTFTEEDKMWYKGSIKASKDHWEKITLRTKFDVIEENTEFLVIEADTSYNALLGRLWYHANGVVPSTYHQCLKFSLGKDKDGNEKEGCIIADNAPFSKEESYYADARYYNIPKHQKKDDKKKEVENRKTSKCLFRYVPKSQRLPEDGGLRPTNLVRTLKNDYSFTLKRTDCSHVENSNQFIVPRKGDKPIRFHTPIDEGYSNLDGPESSSKEGLDIKEAEYNPKMMQMFHKMGLKREEADSPEQRPLFDKIMSNEHRIALFTGNKLKTNRLAAALHLPECETTSITVGVKRILRPYKEMFDEIQCEPLLATANVVEGHDLDWQQPFIDYLQHGQLPENRAKKAEVYANQLCLNCMFKKGKKNKEVMNSIKCSLLDWTAVTALKQA
ncbi:hypothetical protein BUALT_BualtUnG0054700 [Buddleja alternifolia]|uniref:Retrotransposon gag domain-containing protein n=1 Tax=Buddleja alternifolia TaxID=168488 RepID=A0AAV6W6S9_9LAMI|nr:hypothetical protein BUALT_BualtUnG0054700 [Buddleja alternifolia]